MRFTIEAELLQGEPRLRIFDADSGALRTPVALEVRYPWRIKPIRSTPMPEQTLDKPAAGKTLNKILELELAGVARYTPYSFMVIGYNGIPIVSWLRDQASESLQHAYEAGEMITLLGEHPSLAIGPLLETHSHDIGDILRESLEHEQASLMCFFVLF